MREHHARGLGILVILSLLLAACGSAAAPATTAPTSAPAATTAPTDAPTAGAEPTTAPAAAPTSAPAAEPTAAPISNATPIKIGFSAWPGWFPWQIAVEKGLFAKNGVNVEMVWFEGYLDSINAFATGQLDGNTQTLNDTLSSVAAGSEQVIVLVNDNSTGNDQIIVKPEIASITDLKGKTIAAELGTVDHFLLLLGLQKAGLSAKDINFQPLETGAAAAAFAAGQVDAVGVFAPFTTQALSTGKGKVLFSSKDFPGAIPDHLVLSRKLIAERPDDVQKIVNTWFDVLQFIKDNPAEAYAIMAKRASVSIDDYQTYNAGTRIFNIDDNLKAFAPGDDMTHLSYAATQISDFLLANELAKTKPDLATIFDDRFVKAYAAK
jgi:NitT/TauT family transport system substrate-binding protein